MIIYTHTLFDIEVKAHLTRSINIVNSLYTCFVVCRICTFMKSVFIYYIKFLICTYIKKKLKGVGLFITEPPQTSSTILSKKCDYWHLTIETWHLTRDIWHMTPFMWHVTHGREWKFSQNISSPVLTVGDRQCLADSKQKDD